MKPLILSYISKFLSAIAAPLAGAGAYLSGKGVVDMADAASVDAACVSIAAGAIVIATAIASRLLGKLLKEPSSAGDSGAAGTSGWAFWLATCATAAGIMGALPSCATSASTWAAISKVPFRACVITPQGQVCYSSKAGIEVDVDASSGK